MDLNRLTLIKTKSRIKLKKSPPPRHRPGEHFIKGPIPLKWLIQASKLPGKALHVSVVIWYRAGLENNRTIKLSNINLKAFGLTRYAKKRALIYLETAGLIAVIRHTGRAPVVTILEGP